MKIKNKKTVKSKEPKPKRTHNISFNLNDKEHEAIEAYCTKYRVKNRSRFFRESIIRAIIARFMEDYPTLFDMQELDNMVTLET